MYHEVIRVPFFLFFCRNTFNQSNPFDRRCPYLGTVDVTVPADTLVFTYYSDSGCKTETSGYAITAGSGSDDFTATCTAFSCTDISGHGLYTVLECSDDSVTDAIGSYAGYIDYSDSNCATATSAYWALTDECFADAYDGISSEYFSCDTNGYVDMNICPASTDCSDCVAAPISTNCTADSGTSRKGQCDTTSSSSPSSSSSDNVCFSGDDSVTLESGAAKLFSEVAIGDKVQTADATGALSFSNVVALPHAVNKKLASFVDVVTASGKSLKATKMHLLQQCDGSLAYAGSLSKGDCLRTVDGDEAVTALSMTKAEGIYTAVTTNEFLVVNGIVASPFAVTHGLVNSFYNLHRTVAKFMPTALASPLALAVNAFLGGSFLAAGNSK